MDKNSLFSAFSLVAVFIYMYIGVYTYKQDMRSNIHKVFLALCTSYAIWSFAYAFAYVSNDKYVFSYWNKISAIGWSSFSAISLYLVLLITDNKYVKKTIVKILIFSPAVVFFYMAVFLFGEGIDTAKIISDIFYIGDFLYNCTFLLFSIIIIFVWGLRTDSIRIKIQSRILVVSSIIPFILNLLTQTILPAIGLEVLPLMGQLYAVIMIIGAFIVITKYKFLKIPEEFIVEEVTNIMIDMVILLNDKGEVIRISKHTLDMLGFEEKELLNRNISQIFEENDRKKLSITNMRKKDNKHNDINILKKNGESIPVNISSIPIYDSKIHDFLGVIMVMQDISLLYELKSKNKLLEEKAIRDSLTKLYNHQYSVELIKKEVDNAMVDENKYELSIMMLDIDYFKKVNDIFGHQFGDYVLETVANMLIDNVKDAGYVGRFGGEEFIIILPQIGICKAYNMGEKIRSEIEKYEFENGLKLTVSIGIKQHKGESSIELVKNADDLLYKAKGNGRNRIELDPDKW